MTLVPLDSSPTWLSVTLHCAGGRPCLTRPLLADLILGLLAPHPLTAAVCLLPDHLHWLLRAGDEGVVPRFQGWSSDCAARLGLKGPLWSRPPLCERVLEPAAAAAHILANPVRLGLVRDACLWPWSHPGPASLRRGGLRGGAATLPAG